MKMFFLLILSAYLTLWHEMSRIKWKVTRINNDIDLNHSSLQKNSFSNKIICFSFKKKKGEYQYVYYAKRVIILISTLLIPWFFCVYLYEWYNIKQFLLIHLIISIFICSAPTNVFNIIFAMYEKKKHIKDN